MEGEIIEWKDFNTKIFWRWIWQREYFIIIFGIFVMILDELPEESQKGTQLGWITGFTWSRLQIIDYKSYHEVVHGAVPKDLIPIVFRKLKISRTFKEHIWIDIFKFINIIIILLGFLAIIIGLATKNFTVADLGLSAMGLGWLLK